MGVLLAACFDSKFVDNLRSHAGERVLVRLEGNNVMVDYSKGR